MYRIAKVSIQLIYHDTIQSPIWHIIWFLVAPCHPRPGKPTVCKKDVLAKTDKCTRTGSGFWETDYKCDCPPDKIYKWSNTTNRCEACKYPCSSPERN